MTEALILEGVTIRIKRGLKANLPPEAPFGEPLVTTDTGELFLGQGTGKPLKQLTIDPESLKELLERPEVPTFEAGDNVTITQVDNTITISSTAGDTTIIENPQTHTHHHHHYDVELSQVTKMDVLASPEKPKYVAFSMIESLDLVRPPVNVLKFVPSENKMHTTIRYDNRDATDFEPDDFMVYDEIMRMRVNYTPAVEDLGMLDSTYKLLSVQINKSDFKNVQRVEVFGYGASVHK